MGKSFLNRYFAGTFLVILFKQEKVLGQILKECLQHSKEKCGANFSTKFKFFLAASNFLKSAFEHNTAEDLVQTAGKNICMGKSFLERYFAGSFW